MIHLVTGGARSGKSRYAEQQIAKVGQSVCYIATAQPFDIEMKQRIARHRSERPASWQTIETHRHIVQQITQQKITCQAFILDCVTLLVTNHMLASELDFASAQPAALGALEQQISDEITALISYCRQRHIELIIVTNELGSGIVPADKMTRHFRDIAGRINQTIAQLADKVTLVVCGQPLVIKQVDQ